MPNYCMYDNMCDMQWEKREVADSSVSCHHIVFDAAAKSTISIQFADKVQISVYVSLNLNR